VTGKLDLVISPLCSSDEREFTSFSIASDVLVVAARHGHPLLRTSIKIHDLLGTDWLLPAESLASTTWLNRAFEARGLPRPRLQVETDTVTLLRRIVAKTDLLTFISRRDLTSGLSEVKVPGLAMPRHIGVLVAAGRYMPPAAQRLLSVLRKLGRTVHDRDAPGAEGAGAEGRSGQDLEASSANHRSV
jgi:DNA-binding transcriptional LysR family regulator